MALQIIYTSIVGAPAAVTLAAFDEVFVSSGVTVGSTTTDAIIGVAGGGRVHVAGNVIGGSAGIRLGDDATDSGYYVEVAPTGYVTAGGATGGIRLSGFNSHVVNLGTVSGYYGVVIGSAGAGSGTTLFNSGTIAGYTSAILSVAGSTEQLTITNTGDIVAGTSGQALDTNGTNAVEILYNRGGIVGDLNFGAGADIYDGRGGTVQGDILGGAGADRFVAGLGIETIDGGSDNDILDFRSASAVKIALDGAFANTGTAEGDIYTNIETIYGSNTGADVIRGSALADTLYGGGGNDVMAGMAGNDALVGGNGADVMNGGAGNDVFVFASAAQGGDVISDFTNVVGNNDFFRIVAAGFGAGLAAGALPAAKFWATNTNLAHDADDRFIFRTTDKTLWFDSNGNVAGGLTLLADLQATAVVTAADIVLV